MATVVNARDTQIMSANPRYLGVTMLPNVQVSQSNVTGLGLIVEGMKQIWLASTTQVFQIAKDGTTQPGSITLTANVKNLTATPTLTIVSGSMSIVPTLTNGVFTYTPSQQTSDVLTLRLTLTEASKTYTDDVTIVKVREGLDAVTGLLTNESVTLPADNSGNVSSYAGADGRFKVYQGATDVTNVCTFTIPAGGNVDNLTVSLTASGASAGTYSVTGAFPAGKDTTSLTIRATFGTTVIDKVFSLAKAKAGPAGANGAAGAAGAAGQRGSRTFYVAIAGSAWNDTTATTAASVSGGPVINDTVVMYNNSANFSQTRYWSGSAWVVVNAVVDGSLLVSGSVAASSLTLNNGAGANLWADANFADTSVWRLSNWGNFPVQMTVTDGASGGTSMRSPTGSVGSAYGRRRIAVTVGRKYKISCRARRSADANGSFYFRFAGGTSAINASNVYEELPWYPFEGMTPGTVWTYYAAEWTATVPFISPGFVLNNLGSAPTGWMEVQDIRIEEKLDSSLIVQGGITADSIDTRGLSIKDANGNVILAAGSALSSSYVNPDPNWLNSNVGGQNMLYGPLLSFSAPPGVYGNGGTIKTSGNNPYSLQPGEYLTMSAVVSRDAAAIAAGHHAYLYLYCASSNGQWSTQAIISTQGTGRQSVTLQLPANAVDITTVGVGVYHIGGDAALSGTVSADMVQVERGRVATQYKPGVEPGATNGATWGTNLLGRPANIAALGGSEVINNSQMSINAAGQLLNAGTVQGQATLPGMGLKTYRVLARGNYTNSNPVNSGMYADGATSPGWVSVRSYMMARISRTTGNVTFAQFYDVYGEGAIASGRGSAQLAADLNASTANDIVVVWTFDEPCSNRLANGLDTAMYRCGASKAVFGSPNFKLHSAYILVGIPGVGEGGGAEAYQGKVPQDPNAWCDLTFSVVNGALTGVSATYKPSSLTDYGYTGDIDAQNNSRIGINASGQLTGIGAGAGTVVSNNQLQITYDGRLTNAGVQQGQMTYLPTVDNRNSNYPPSSYSFGTIREFKDASIVGLNPADGPYLLLETIRQWTDDSGGPLVQYAYQGTKTFRRTGTNAGGWGSWVQDLDRNAYTGDLNATFGATAGVNVKDPSGNTVGAAKIMGNLFPADVWRADQGNTGSGVALIAGTVNLLHNASYPQPQGPISSVVVSGGPDGVQRSMVRSTSGTASDGQGGWDYAPSMPIDRTKAYRFLVFFRKYGTAGGTFLQGCGGGIRDVGGADNGNPYFHVRARNDFVDNRWYLSVGYIYPEQYTGGQPNNSAIYDLVTGARVSTGTDYQWNSGATSCNWRTYQYYTTGAGAVTEWCAPRVDVLDGTEPTIEALMAQTMVSARNPITSANASTYLANAAIGLAQINKATITDLSALSATIGTLRTATSGGRTEIMDNKIRVYDTSNALRVSVGYLL